MVLTSHTLVAPSALLHRMSTSRSFNGFKRLTFPALFFKLATSMHESTYMHAAPNA